MEENLAEVMKGMSLGEDKSIIIPEDDDYCAIKSGGRSMLGRLLNPECQNMGRMLKTMPKIWKVYDRARGLALTKERFQFIFELETDIQMVLKQGFWTFDDWGMAMERWVEVPPPNYLQYALVWVRLYNLPANYLTLKTIDTIADGIGHVEIIEFDPAKPLLNDYVRVQVTLDLNLPLRDKKSVTLPGGRIEYVDVAYERVRKKCFHCLRLSHEKIKCPLLQGARNKGKGIVSTAKVQSVDIRQHHTNLADKIMPLLAPAIPPGFEPPVTVVAPEVFEQMRIYMNCTDPDERNIREARMKKTLDDLSNDPIAQRSCLRLERAPTLSVEMNRSRGRIFDFSRVQEKSLADEAESSSHGPASDRNNARSYLADKNQSREMIGTSGCQRIEQRSRHRGSQGEGSTLPLHRGEGDLGNALPDTVGFVMGSGGVNTEARSNRSRGSQRSKSSWSRRKQDKRRNTMVSKNGSQWDKEDGTSKRKAEEDGEVSSKVSRHNNGSMVHQKPSSSQ
ncbi:hypothetical protein BRARA_I04094 [Brassica rapa]|uniref:DUF4283 domain-containing protein n=1 Tax=Brassica campestris TaxID=3711 RepID=A0A397Y2R6_BRACM|nr:hypothetical protein BRARA_I04094 [Brassica rapa]